jgi:3-hydroxyacyl-[acyl-carrier-protein] dehydratase
MTGSTGKHHAGVSLAGVQELIPHRPPFLFVDKLESWENGKIVGTRLFTLNDDFFRGHFPGYPVVPGVILIESMAQCGGAGVLKRGILPPHAIIFLAAVHDARFRQPVRPGEEIRMEIDDVRVTPRMLKQKGKATVAGVLVAEAEWMCLAGVAK